MSTDTTSGAGAAAGTSEAAESAKSGQLSRRQVLLAGAAVGLSLPVIGGLTTAASLALSAGPAHAATAGQCVLGVTQEAVNFNPMLYVNTGVEFLGRVHRVRRAVEDRPFGRLHSQSRGRNPEPGEQRHFEGRPRLDDRGFATTWPGTTARPSRDRRRVHPRRADKPQGDRAQPQPPRARRTLRGGDDTP